MNLLKARKPNHFIVFCEKDCKIAVLIRIQLKEIGVKLRFLN